MSALPPESKPNLQESCFFYQAFGLNIASEIEIPQIESVAPLKTTDVIIKKDAINPDDMEAVHSGVLWKTAPDCFQLGIEGIATLQASNGNEIVVDAAQDANPKDIGTYILGSVMGALLHQRRVLPLHASAVEIDGYAVLFAGVSGAGKSTLAAALNQKGYRLITDCLLYTSDAADD